MKHCFPNDQCTVLQNHTAVKDPFKAQDRPMDFSVIEYEKFMNMVSEGGATNL